MAGTQRILAAVGKYLNDIGGVTLTLMMLLTVTDVVLRYLGKPLTGTYELMSMAGALVIGLTIAQTSLDNAHVNVDMLTQALADRSWSKRILLLFTRLLGIGIFAQLAWALYLKGNDLYGTHEVSLTLQVPIYPVAYGLSLCCLVESLVLVARLFREWTPGGEHE
ncbi:MAG: TRAP transporter small permease [Deltaproteobacteria bacterium]|nr:TRAP transporter small permease [Deltaproteobacteria bacterium]